MILEQEPDMVLGAGAGYGPGAGARYGPAGRSWIWSQEQELEMVLE